MQGHQAPVTDRRGRRSWRQCCGLFPRRRRACPPGWTVTEAWWLTSWQHRARASLMSRWRTTMMWISRGRLLSFVCSACHAAVQLPRRSPRPNTRQWMTTDRPLPIYSIHYCSMILWCTTNLYYYCVIFSEQLFAIYVVGGPLCVIRSRFMLHPSIW